MARDTSLKALQAALDKSVREQKIPGATACLITPEATWEFASGISSRHHRAPMRPRDRFRIASISKVFVATVVLQLYDEGALDLDDTLADWLAPKIAERFPNPGKITIRHLLNHTSGLDDYLNTDGFAEATEGRPYDQPWRAWEAIRYAYDLEPLAKPGKQHHYSNTNYLLLDVIVETATGNPVYREIRTRLLEPLELRDTFTETFEPVPGGFVEGYEDLDEDGRQDRTSGVNAGAGLADGGLVSSARDVAHFSHTLFTTNELLTPETWEARVAWVDDGGGNYYGLGLCGWSCDWGNGWGHSGYTDGFLSTLWHLIDQGVTLVVLANDADHSAPDDIAQAMLEVFFG